MAAGQAEDTLPLAHRRVGHAHRCPWRLGAGAAAAGVAAADISGAAHCRQCFRQVAPAVGRPGFAVTTMTRWRMRGLLQARPAALREPG